MTGSTEPTEPAMALEPTAPSEPTAQSEPAMAPKPREPRPMIERVGLAIVALVLASLFGVVSAASWVGGELFLAAMAGIGCLMTMWVGAMTLVRG